MAQQRPTRAPANQPKRFPVIPVVVAGVVALAAVAILATSLSSGSRSTKDPRPNLAQNRAVTVTGGALTPYDSSGHDAAVGAVAPAVQGQSFDGTPVSIANDGAPKVILFVAHWCPHCEKEVPLLAGWLRTHQPPQGMKLYTISTSVRPDYPNYPASAWLERVAWTVPTVADDANGTAAQQFGLTGFPYFVAVDGSGKVVQRASGELPIATWEALLAMTAGLPALVGS